MKQKVTVSQSFSDLSKTIKICAVYLKENTLIAVANILPTGHRGEAVCTRKDSITVETNSDKILPVKSIFLEKGETLDNIREIKGLQALPLAMGLSSQQGVFSKTTYSFDDSDEDASQEPTMY